MSNFNFESLTSYAKSLAEIEAQIKNLIDILGEGSGPFNDDDRVQLIKNILWLKRFYEAAERNLLNDK